MDKLNYIAIFEYYDYPLFFISQENNNYYLYYCMEENLYFRAIINTYYIKELYAGKSVRDILQELINDNGEVVNTSLNDTVPSSSFKNIKDYLPEMDYKIEYDYLGDKSINENYDYKNKFPLLFNNLEISFHLKRQNNGTVFPASIIEKVISSIRKISEKCMPGSELGLDSFSPGSFKINCELNGNGNLLNDNLDFDNLIYEIERINFADLSKERNESFVLKDVKKFYDFLDKNKIEAEILSRNNVRLMDFKNKGHYLENNFKLTENDDVISEKKISGYFESISIKRNSFTMRISERNAIKEISGKFDSDLFNKIKNKEIELVLLKEMNCLLQENTKGKYFIKDIIQINS